MPQITNEENTQRPRAQLHFLDQGATVSAWPRKRKARGWRRESGKTMQPQGPIVQPQGIVVQQSNAGGWKSEGPKKRN